MNARGTTTFRCGPGARWLPRTLAVAVLLAGLLAVARVDPGAGVPGAGTLRTLLVVATAIAALWVVRKGAETRLSVTVGEEALSFERGPHRVELAFDDINAIDYETPFGPSRNWLPAAVLVDREGRDWRLSALLTSGERLIVEIVERGGRPALGTWAAERRVAERMARAGLRVRFGYGIALGVLVVAALLWLH